MKRFFYLVIVTLLYITTNDGSCANDRYWIFFTTKQSSQTQPNENNVISQRALLRRSKNSTHQPVFDQYDKPINPCYIQQLEKIGIQPLHISRWLNAVSAFLTPKQIATLKQFSWIRSIEPVRNHRPFPIMYDSAPIQKSGTINQALAADYGPSLTQNEQIHVTDVHALGVNGQGVLIGMLDTGFLYKQHEALKRMKVIAEYDFINNDPNTANELDNNDYTTQHNHGTNTLSVIGGYMPGSLIGPAYNADFLLGKTEDIRSETALEEDYWVAGLEWMESQGVDIISSSLGYNGWYEYEAMDGETAITTRAADIAAKKGVLVVNAMGNEGDNSWKYMIAPADGDSVVAVGAVTSEGTLTSFSSVGPTADGRIKPDVVAMGANVYCATPSTSASYSFVRGTSFSTPIVAGVAALILSAHPELTPMQIREALRKTADRADNPDNFYGWGLVNSLEALYYHGLFFSNVPTISHTSEAHHIQIGIYSKYPVIADSVFLFYSSNDEKYVKIQMQHQEAQQYAAAIPVVSGNALIRFYISAQDDGGYHRIHPIQAPEAYFSFRQLDTTISPPNNNFQPETIHLYANYPNPFNNRTTIHYDLPISGDVNLAIYNAIGQLVTTVVDEFQPNGAYTYYWNGTNQHGVPVTSGVYLCRLSNGNMHKMHKLMLLR
jgi:serine protease AprX